MKTYDARTGLDYHHYINKLEHYDNVLYCLVYPHLFYLLQFGLFA
jgi:hypothetical protein